MTFGHLGHRLGARFCPGDVVVHISGLCSLAFLENEGKRKCALWKLDWRRLDQTVGRRVLLTSTPSKFLCSAAENQKVMSDSTPGLSTSLLHNRSLSSSAMASSAGVRDVFNHILFEISTEVAHRGPAAPPPFAAPS